MDNEEDLDYFFELEYAGKTVHIKPKIKELFPVGKLTGAAITENLVPASVTPLPQSAMPKENTQLVVVLAQHKYYSHLVVELYEAAVAPSGKLKNPLKAVSPLDRIWQCEKSEELKFYTGISKFQHNYNSTEPTETDIIGLKAIINNPLQLPIFYHNPQVSENITAKSVVPVQLKTSVTDLTLAVHVKDKFYEITGQISLDLQVYDLQKLKLKYGYFVQLEGSFYLITQLALSRVILFFKQHHGKIIIHESKFEEFRESVLAKLEHKIVVSYSYLKPATPQQLQETGFTTAPEKLIYLSDSEDYITITPVVRYGQLEIPVLSKKQIQAVDSQGRPFLVARDQEIELQFTATVIKQHPDFYEQLKHDYFYLHRKRFLEEGWFLEAFETWRSKEITILGFNQLQNNKLNAHQAKVAISVASGLDWFDTSVAVSYGKQKVSLQHLHKALRNKSKFVALGDGTLGILPAAWLAKFTQYFSAGEVVGESIRTPKTNFSDVADLYETQMLRPEVHQELAFYRHQLNNFAGIAEVPVPAELQTTLRDYQKQGLNWLNFLDGFNFGGCLADDMGLGKTIQVIAFILSQRRKNHPNTNLIVVPTSLIFNWQAEVAKFAPSIKVLTIYGTDRLKEDYSFGQYEIILTSYGTLLADIKFLKNYRFNYIILDESQAIKNPESQRYKAVRLLHSRNKVVLTGTPVENNTFDLYGQLSFALPGLLGSKQFFKAHYATPIDKFKDSKRAQELQKKIKPFILRRTKEQVARELPDKTEMVIYCEMGAEQRQVYDTYAHEIREYLLAPPEDNLPKNSMQVLQGLTKLRQICNSPALLPDEKYYGNASAKIETLLEQIESKAPHHKILVFSQFVTMLELIKKE
ncbi:MAG TPA: SNF2-related protein, partial [Segetibacter sp.]